MNLKKIIFIMLIFLFLQSTISFAAIVPQIRDFAIYVDTGTWQPSIIAFEYFLTWKNMTWQEIDSGTVNQYNLSSYFKGIWMPGGWAWNYKKSITDAGDAHIRELVSLGGVYMGASAGAYYACDRIKWEGKEYPYTLDLFKGICIGPIDEIAPWPNYVMTTMNINQPHTANVFEPSQRDVLYYGEPYFVPDAGQEMLSMANYIVPADHVHINDTTAPTINSINDSPDPVIKPNNITFDADVTDNFGVKKVEVEFDGIYHDMVQNIAPAQSQIFFDGFESGSFGPKWKSFCRTGGGANNWNVANTNPYQGTYHAQVKQPRVSKNATLQFNFSTEGYLDITLRYYRR